jgi:hypothetical protein
VMVASGVLATIVLAVGVADVDAVGSVTAAAESAGVVPITAQANSVITDFFSIIPPDPSRIR